MRASSRQLTGTSEEGKGGKFVHVLEIEGTGGSSEKLKEPTGKHVDRKLGNDLVVEFSREETIEKDGRLLKSSLNNLGRAETTISLSLDNSNQVTDMEVERQDMGSTVRQIDVGSDSNTGIEEASLEVLRDIGKRAECVGKQRKEYS
ncbi:hypothetical protein ACH5RR_001300 [Cinchona calisaya]|uniref:Uncharacterized protein n=1 Tax=Cinchona calisaya TaxID=153742 RepID=A0ABD3B484_9GENT